ncbi:MAG: DNA translocase FtsK 4TM domain-containing protein [Patescibacteria group bacterium]
MVRVTEKKKTGFWTELKDETKHSVLAITFFTLTIFFILAGVGIGGVVGDTAYQWLSDLFGWGFFLFPLVSLLLGMALMKSVRPNLVIVRLVGAAVFFLAALGWLTAALGHQRGGLAGQLIAAPLVKLFDIYLGLILLTATMVIALIIMFDTKFYLHPALWRWWPFRRSPSTTNNISTVDTAVLPAPTLPLETEIMVNEPTKTVAPATTGNVSEDIGSLGKTMNWGKGGQWQNFEPPPLNLLENDSGKPAAGDIKTNANLIKRTLANFGIVVEMDEVTIGPSITRYALKPAEGVKLSRIVALQNDLSLALAAHPLRIEAPIPGKSLVGIEVPNQIKSTVGLAAIIGSKEFKESPLPLLVSIGRGISGQIHFANLARAPHILIAGATGSGKSVVIHTFIVSLLYRASPDQLRFIMIDPKRVELTVYNRIPHLLTSVVTDAKKAILVLKWAIGEMERRYEILEKSAVRDVSSYHQNIKERAEKMPYIVIVIDELADIMSAYPRELEGAIVRLAQMSRAVGIHLILSTQRPSVEVITGIIKANIPSRLALQVASQIDSRTILDMAGAEKLLGAGDLLYLSGEMSKPLRLQSAFISETEVKKVVNFLAGKYEPELDQIILAGNDETLATGGHDGGEAEDELYEAAREIVIEAGKASASYLQRKLKVGYARAARLLDLLEERGVIGQGDGAKPREVYHSGPNNNL